jgi:hypothetical protein
MRINPQLNRPSVIGHYNYTPSTDGILFLLALLAGVAILANL